MTLVSIAVAMDRRGTIGRDGGLPWHIPEDLRHFRHLTLGKPIVMGRRTWLSIGRPLSGRHNIVVSTTLAARAEGCTVVPTLAQALAAAGAVAEVVVIGGARLYAEALPLAGRLYVTRVDAEVTGDVCFPPFDAARWRSVAIEGPCTSSAAPYRFSFEVLERRDGAAC